MIYNTRHLKLYLPLIAFLFAAWSPQLHGQELSRFQDYTQKDGLVSNYVLTVIEDHLGFIWMGTESGLSRYDGNHAVQFRYDPVDSTSLNGNWITALYEDSQHNIWVGTRTGLSRVKRETGKFDRIALKSEGGEDVIDEITSCLEDASGNLWVLSLRSGLYKIESQNTSGVATAQSYAYSKHNFTSSNNLRLSHLITVTGDYLWLATTQGLDRLQLSTKEVLSLKAQALSGHYTGEVDHVRSLFTSEGSLVLQIAGKIYRATLSDSTPELKLLPRFSNNPAIDPETVLRPIVWKDDQTIISSDRSQLYTIDTRTGEQGFLLPKEDLTPLFPHPISALYKDSKNGLWVGTVGGGVKYLSDEKPIFTFYQHEKDDPNSLSRGSVRTFAEDRNGKLWVGILDGGIEKFSFSTNPEELTKEETITARANALNSDQVIKVLADQQRDLLWVATNNKGLNRVNINTGEVFHYPTDSNAPNATSGDRIWGLNQDNDGFIWIGTWAEGLNKLDPNTGKIVAFEAEEGNPNSLVNNGIRYIHKAPDGMLWIGTINGLNRLDPKTHQFTSYTSVPGDSSTLSNKLVWSIQQDQQGYVWVGTDVGLNRLDPQTGEVEQFYEHDGLPSNSIYGLLEDRQGNLWISTDNGLSRRLPGGKTPTFRTLNIQDEMGNVSFIPKAIFQSPSTGSLFLGSPSKMVVVEPDLLGQDTFSHQLKLHSFSKFRVIGEKGKTEVDYFIADKATLIELGHKDQSITLQLADLSWRNKEDFHYEFKLDGFNGQWMDIPDDMEVSFTNLDPGRYTFTVRTINASNIPTRPITLLSLRVFPPWWQSITAYIAYLLLLVGMVYMAYRFQLNRHLQKQETENLKALDAYKNQLYTNITHEFKTPLTVISGVIEQVQGFDKAKKQIKRSSRNLLSLVNQILDLRKLEEGRFEVKWVQGDIIAYLKYLVASYKALAELKDIELHFLAEAPELYMDFDKEAMQRILSNLLSNGIKFTPQGGNVYLQVQINSPAVNKEASESGLVIYVKDDGIGISEKDQKNIFDRFYQVEEGKRRLLDKNLQYRGPGGGTGIGLAMTKELVQLTGGTISVSSTLGKGTTFRLSFPIHQHAPQTSTAQLLEEKVFVSQDNSSPTDFPTAPTPIKENALSVLLIEDNRDVMDYLITLLENRYELYVARDGEEGIEMALEHIPDLIVSDVMMPRKDGFEVCATLKEDERTSHIPIILLTAKSSVESRLEGLQRGADAYLAKPFDQRELYIRLERLAQLRQLLRDRYQSLNPILEPEESNPFAREDVFMQKLQAVITNKMRDAEFGISQLCLDMGMSRSQLHLKIKALTNRSTSHFIRAIRLQKAKELLGQATMNVTEISYEVGFNDPAYFSKKFTEEFGLSPKKYMGNSQ